MFFFFIHCRHSSTPAEAETETMRPPFNYFQPQARPQQQQQQQQNNGYQNQLGMMNPQNPMMGHMIPMPNMPIHHPHFFFNNMHQQQHQFGLPNQFLPNLNLMAQPNFFRPPPLGPYAFSSLNSFNPLSYPNQHQNHQLRPPQAGNFNGSNTKGNDFPNKHQKGFQSSQLHGSNKKSGFNKGKRNYNKMSTSHHGSGVDSIAKDKKRPYVCFYTPKEIQLWREARRRNFPTKLNIQKKSKKNVSQEEAKLRRQQLQEVVAKQAELGVEVAQVPSHYLSRTQEQANGNRGDNNGQALNDKPDGRRGRSQNNKTRHGEKEKPRSEDQNSSQESSITLLGKLVSADMKRDKSRLLQVLRFMVMNSFFKDQLPLKLPLVMVEEHVREDEAVVDMNGDDNSCDKAVER